MSKKRKGLAGGIISIIVGSILVIIGISMIITAMSAPDHTYIDSDFSDNLMGGIFCTIFGAMFIVTGIRSILGRNKKASTALTPFWNGHPQKYGFTSF